jgi:hypothetical protein
MLTKDIVVNWVSKCEARAKNSILEKHEIELIELTKANPKLLNLYKTILDMNWSKNILTEMFKENNLSKDTALSIQINGIDRWNSYYSLYTLEKPLHIIGKVIQSNKEEYTKEHEVISAFIDKMNDVQQEYKLLKNKCYDFRKAKDAVRYLNDIGFDTSSLVPPVEKPLDKSKLFVCGDNKPELPEEK